MTRYSRHVLLPEVGVEGQRKLKEAKVLVVGAGGLGSPAALYLAAAGVGHIGILDYDKVEESNLQRQVLYSTADVGKSKSVCAAGRLWELNPEVQVTAHGHQIMAMQAESVVSIYDVVIDGSDNFGTRYLMNDACVLLRKPLVYGSVFRFDGQVSVFNPPAGPCYRCLFPHPPTSDAVPNCAEAGVLGVLAGTIGTLQATEALKLILGIGQPLLGRLLTYDALSMNFDTMNIERDPDCPICGVNPSIIKLRDEVVACITESDLDAGQVKELMAKRKDLLLLDVRTSAERAAGAIQNSLSIPLDELSSRLKELTKNRETVVYCQSGTRSAKACGILREAGFTRVHNLVGGFGKW